ncbi:MAG: class I tRNA ligase family protein [Acidobacteriota bacterium]
MKIQKVDSEKFYTAYGIRCQQVYPWQGVTDTPFFTAWAVVPPGGIARAHKHQEHESFVIVKGRGRMTIDGESREVEPGDVVLMEPFTTHELVNLSDDEELMFLDLAWEDLIEAVGRNDAALANGHSSGEPTRRVLATATPPTPNGDLHVGHLSGPYLSADLFTRYHRMRGRDAAYLTGVDDHQSYTEAKGEVIGETARAVADRFGDAIEGTLELADIRLDVFARPKTSPYHVERTQEVFRRMVDNGSIVAREAPTPYCVSCECYLFEAYIVGRCPHCGESSHGNACEPCARPNDCADLLDATCVHCGNTPELRPYRRFYFPLAPFAERLEAFWDRTHMGPHLRALCDTMLDEGLPDIAVSQQTDWGVRVPIEGYEDQAIYVWFEMAPGFLAATEELGEGREDAFWRTDDAEVVQFFGFDNGYFFAVLFPAIFMAYDEAIRLPTTFVTNEFYRYEGSKFSTSRNHAMWGRELLDRVPADVARFYLAWDGPETEQTNFTFAELQDTVDRELSNHWQGWLHDLHGKLADSDYTVPSTGAWSDDQQRFFQQLIDLVAEAAAAYEARSFSPQRAARVAVELVRLARRFSAAQTHWKGLPGRYEIWRTALALEVLAAKTLAMITAPLMPSFADRLWRTLGQEGSIENARWEEIPQFVPGGRRVKGLDAPWFAASETLEVAAS